MSANHDCSIPLSELSIIRTRPALVKVSDWNLFWTNQIYSEICNRTHPSQSDFNLVWCKSVEDLSELIRYFEFEWIRTNFFNPYESEVRIIRIENLVEIILTSNSFGLRTSFGFIRIGSLGLNRIEFWLRLKISYWDGLIFNQITLNEIENFFRIDLDELGLVRIQTSQWILLVQNNFQFETVTRAVPTSSDNRGSTPITKYPCKIITQLAVANGLCYILASTDIARRSKNAAIRWN